MSACEATKFSHPHSGPTCNIQERELQRPPFVLVFVNLLD